MKTRLVFAILLSLLVGCKDPNPNIGRESDAPKPQSLNAHKDWAVRCAEWDDWDKIGPPFKIHSNSYYVGTCGISAILITGAKGHILIDGGTEKGAEIILDNIASLGFQVSDINILLYSHEHFDHVGGLANIQRQSGAELYASPAAKPVLSTGLSAVSDPQYGMHAPFAAAKVSKTIFHGETVSLGELPLKAIATPGHTEGALSWQWESCETDACEMIVYADSLSPISRDGYNFADHLDYLAKYRRGLDELSQLDCTLILTPHPSASGMHKRLLKGKLSDAAGCIDYANKIEGRLDKRLAEDISNKPK